MLRHRNLMFRQWASLEDIVRGRPSATGPSSRPNLDERAANENFIRAMYAVTRGLAPSVVDRIDLRGVRTVADLGGGPGVYLEEMARRAPGLELYLADLPLTLEVARKILAGSELAGRIRLVAWDIYRDPPPDVLPALDLALLSQVLHGESPEANRDLLARVATRLAPGGRIVVHERIVDPGRTSPYDAAIFAVNMLAMTPGGNVCTEEEIHGWGREAGLVPEPGERLSPRSYLVRLRRPV
jgi:SAM-dependent methyltransferase